MKKAVAIYDGFVGHHGQAIRVVGGQEYPVSASIVQEHPQHFQFSDDGAKEMAGPGETAAQRLARLRSELAQAEELAAAEAAEADDQGDELPPYSEWTVAELQREAKARDLSTAGVKADLVARLEKFDAEHPEEAGD